MWGGAACGDEAGFILEPLVELRLLRPAAVAGLTTTSPLRAGAGGINGADRTDAKGSAVSGLWDFASDEHPASSLPFLT